MSLSTGHKILGLTPRQEKIDKLFTGHLKGSVTLQPGGWFLPRAHQKFCQEIKEFEFDESDILVVTIPKAGTTWTQETVWTIKKNPDLDNPEGKEPLHMRSPVLEADMLVDGVENMGQFDVFTKEQGEDPNKGVFLAVARAAKRPRIFKTHLPFPFIPDSALAHAKIVYTIRDPRDLCISSHHHSRLFKYEGFTGTFEQYVDAFLEGSVSYGPYWEHVKEAWNQRNLPNVYILSYEKMKKNPKEEIAKLAKFLEVDLTDEQIDKIEHHTSFPEMQKRDDHCLHKSDEEVFLNMEYAKEVAGFFRSGQSGEWKNVFSDDQKERFSAWIEANCPDQEIMNIIDNP